MSTQASEQLKEKHHRELIQEESIHGASKTAYWPQLDGFRSMCVLMVFIIHAWVNPGTHPSPIGLLGYFSIDCFFVLSAFLITSLLIKEKATYGNIDYRLFLMRRGLRIWPLFVAVVAFSGFILPMLNFQAALPQYPQFFLQQVLPSIFFAFNFSYPFTSEELHSYSKLIGIPVASAMVVFWTLCMEEHFYTVWPYLVKRASSLSAMVIVLFTLEAITLVARCLVNYLALNVVSVDVPFQLYYMNTLCHLDPLVIGGLIAIAYHKYPEVFRLKTSSALGVSAIFLAVLGYLLTNMHLHFPVSSPLMMVDMTVDSIAAGLLFFLAMSWHPVRSFFSRKAVGVVGRYCFAIYLIHNLVLGAIEQQLNLMTLPDVQWSYFSIKCLIGFPITFGLALLSWKYLESPFHRLKKKFERNTIASQA